MVEVTSNVLKAEFLTFDDVFKSLTVLHKKNTTSRQLSQVKRVCIKIDKFSGERMGIWDVLYENHCGHAGEKRGSMISWRFYPVSTTMHGIHPNIHKS